MRQSSRARVSATLGAQRDKARLGQCHRPAARCVEHHSQNGARSRLAVFEGCDRNRDIGSVLRNVRQARRTTKTGKRRKVACGRFWRASGARLAGRRPDASKAWVQVRQNAAPQVVGATSRAVRLKIARQLSPALDMGGDLRRVTPKFARGSGENCPSDRSPTARRALMREAFGTRWCDGMSYFSFLTLNFSEN